MSLESQVSLSLEPLFLALLTSKSMKVFIIFPCKSHMIVRNCLMYTAQKLTRSKPSDGPNWLYVRVYRTKCWTLNRACASQPFTVYLTTSRTNFADQKVCRLPSFSSRCRTPTISLTLSRCRWVCQRYRHTLVLGVSVPTDRIASSRQLADRRWDLSGRIMALWWAMPLNGSDLRTVLRHRWHNLRMRSIAFRCSYPIVRSNLTAWKNKNNPHRLKIFYWTAMRILWCRNAFFKYLHCRRTYTGSVEKSTSDHVNNSYFTTIMRLLLLTERVHEACLDDVQLRVACTMPFNSALLRWREALS
jgi:hypothetical protein